MDLTARIKTLSKGNRQKIGLVQAFMHRPELLILDEPTSGLDPLVQQTFLDLVREARANGQTVFMSSHIMSEVEAVADRVGIIREGRLVALDTVARLRDRSVHEFQVTFTASARTPEVFFRRSTPHAAVHAKVALSSGYALLLIFSKAITAEPRSDQSAQAKNKEPQVVGLRTQTERRVRNPMIHPLSYECASGQCNDLRVDRR